MLVITCSSGPPIGHSLNGLQPQVAWFRWQDATRATKWNVAPPRVLAQAGRSHVTVSLQKMLGSHIAPHPYAPRRSVPLQKCPSHGIGRASITRLRRLRTIRHLCMKPVPALVAYPVNRLYWRPERSHQGFRRYECPVRRPLVVLSAGDWPISGEAITTRNSKTSFGWQACVPNHGIRRRCQACHRYVAALCVGPNWLIVARRDEQ